MKHVPLAAKPYFYELSFLYDSPASQWWPSGAKWTRKGDLCHAAHVKHRWRISGRHVASRYDVAACDWLAVNYAVWLAERDGLFAAGAPLCDALTAVVEWDDARKRLGARAVGFYADMPPARWSMWSAEHGEHSRWVPPAEALIARIVIPHHDFKPSVEVLS